MKSNKSFLCGVFVGGIVGSSVVLVSAPSSGKHVRSLISQKFSEWKLLAMNLKENGKQLKNQLTKTSKESAILVKKLTKEMKTSVEDWKKIVEPHQENITEQLEEIELSLKELENKVKK